MSAELVSIIALAAMFVVATLLPVNMGALAFVAAFLVGTLAAGMSADDIFAGFPGDIFVTLVGVTYLFAIAQNNGTVDLLVRGAVRLVRGRLAAIPWVMFGVAAVLTAIGAVSPAAVAIIAPVALGFAAQYRINPMLMGLMVVHGAQAGGFSPISVYGTIVNGVVERAELPKDEIVLFLSSLLVNTAIALLVFFVFGGARLMQRRDDEPNDAGPATQPAGRAGTPTRATSRSDGPGAAVATDTTRSVGPTIEQTLTVLGLVVLVVATLGFDLDVGLMALTIAVVLALVAPATQKQAVSQIAWPVVLLIGGMLTYVGVLEEVGTIDAVGEAFADAGSPLTAALLLCFLGAIVSAFASSVGIMGALIPLAVPLLLEGQVSAVGVVAALAVSSTVVDCSPLSTNGALVLANAEGVDRDVLFRRLLAYGAVVVGAAPPIVWAVLVAPGWL